jgi:hypothetical protein
MGHEEYDAMRRRMNEQSQVWAVEQKKHWRPEDDEVILNEWVLVDPRHRDEMGIAKRLARTLFACQGRAEHLRDLLDFKDEAAKRGHAPAPRPVCETCWQEITPAGTCACTD